MPISIRELGLDQLSVDDRLKLAEELWDSIASDVETRAVPDSHREEIERRLDAHRDDPKAGRPWVDVRADLERSGGE
jgi:putative addiction module component (TIGR02574 family)